MYKIKHTMQPRAQFQFPFNFPFIGLIGISLPSIARNVCVLSNHTKIIKFDAFGAILGVNVQLVYKCYIQRFHLIQIQHSTVILSKYTKLKQHKTTFHSY